MLDKPMSRDEQERPVLVGRMTHAVARDPQVVAALSRGAMVDGAPAKAPLSPDRPLALRPGDGWRAVRQRTHRRGAELTDAGSAPHACAALATGWTKGVDWTSESVPRRMGAVSCIMALSAPCVNPGRIPASRLSKGHGRRPSTHPHLRYTLCRAARRVVQPGREDLRRERPRHVVPLRDIAAQRRHSLPTRLILDALDHHP